MSIIVNTDTGNVYEWTGEAASVIAPSGSYLSAGASGVLCFSDTEYASGYIETGDMDLGSYFGKRCTGVTLDTVSPDVDVFLIDSDGTEYDTVPRSGAGTKRNRQFNTPRGVLSTTFKFRVEMDVPNIEEMSVNFVDSSNK